MRKLKQKQKQSQSVVVNVNAPKRRSTRKSAPKPPQRLVQPSLSPYGKFADPFIPREYKPPTLTELLTALRQPAPVKVEAPSIEKTPTATTAPSLGSFTIDPTLTYPSLPTLTYPSSIFTPYTGERPRRPQRPEPTLVSPISIKPISSALNQSVNLATGGLVSDATSGLKASSFFTPYTGERPEKTFRSAIDESIKVVTGISNATSGFRPFFIPKPQSLPGHGLEDDPLERDAKTPAAKVFVSPTPPVSVIDDLAARKKVNPSTGLPPVPAAPTGGFAFPMPPTAPALPAALVPTTTAAATAASLLPRSPRAFFNTGGQGDIRLPDAVEETGGSATALAPMADQPKTASSLVPSLGLVPETETLVDKSTAYAEVLPPEEEEGFVDVEEEPIVVEGKPEVSLSPELPLDSPQGEFTALVPSPEQIAESAQTAPLFAPAFPAPASALDAGGGAAKFTPDVGSDISSLGGGKVSAADVKEFERFSAAARDPNTLKLAASLVNSPPTSPTAASLVEPVAAADPFATPVKSGVAARIAALEVRGTSGGGASGIFYPFETATSPEEALKLYSGEFTKTGPNKGKPNRRSAEGKALYRKIEELGGEL